MSSSDEKYMGTVLMRGIQELVSERGLSHEKTRAERGLKNRKYKKGKIHKDTKT